MAHMRSRSPRRGGIGNGPGPSAIPLADFLLQRGILDERSVDYLKKAPIEFASEVLLSLGPEVRNPSAFITKKLSPLLGAGGGGPEPLHDTTQIPWRISRPDMPRLAAPPPRLQNRPAIRYDDRPPLGRPAAGGWSCTVHCNGEPRHLEWLSQEQVVGQLVEWGMLDENSADFLRKAPEQAAKEIVASLGPDVRNPSACVTRKLKWLKQSGREGYEEDHRWEQAAGETIEIHFNGAAMPLEWFSMEQALANLVSWGVLDEGSAEFLSKVPEHEAKDIVASLGPGVRNPSAVVTRKVKALLQGGGGRQDHVEPVPSLSIFVNGAEMVLNWPSRDEALGQLVAQGILDDRSADFLAKVPEHAAFEIVGKLGPEVRNPSACVTKEAKKWLM